VGDYSVFRYASLELRIHLNKFIGLLEHLFSMFLCHFLASFVDLWVEGKHFRLFLVVSVFPGVDAEKSVSFE